MPNALALIFIRENVRVSNFFIEMQVFLWVASISQRESKPMDLHLQAGNGLRPENYGKNSCSILFPRHFQSFKSPQFIIMSSKPRDKSNQPSLPVGEGLDYKSCMRLCLGRNGHPQPSDPDLVNGGTMESLNWCRFICQVCNHRKAGNDVIPSTK